MTRVDTQQKNSVLAAVEATPRVEFLRWVTPIERQPRLSEKIGVDLWVKRDDLTGLGFGGNKVRHLEFYFGKAKSEGADAVLITGAVQSNYVRVAAAFAARLSMECHIQLEERVPDVDDTYRWNGNVLIDELLGASLHFYPEGEDEEGADRQLNALSEKLASRGLRPYIIPLAANNPAIGALGYIRCAHELLSEGRQFDQVILASGSGHTQAGLVFGLKALGWQGKVHGFCVRRNAELQRSRILMHCESIAKLLKVANPVTVNDVSTFDEVLAPGYGVLNDLTLNTLQMCAHLDALILDPVYTGRAMSGLIRCVNDGRLAKDSRVMFIHTGGIPALFGYSTAISHYIRSKKGRN